MKEIAKYYYGALYSGLEINSCLYPEWKKWYENSHSITENIDLAEAYAAAVYIWTKLYYKN